MKKIIAAVSIFVVLSGSWSCKTVVTDKPEGSALVVRPAQPYPNYVWRNGEWYASGGVYHWREGAWIAPRPDHARVNRH